MMHAAARFKAASRRSRGIIAAGGKRWSQASLDERHLCDAAVSGTACRCEIEIGRPDLPQGAEHRPGHAWQMSYLLEFDKTAVVECVLDRWL
jgi:hypothetical protein